MLFTIEELGNLYIQAKEINISDILDGDFIKDLREHTPSSQEREIKIKLKLREVILGADIPVKELRQLKEKLELQYLWEAECKEKFDLLRVINEAIILEIIDLRGKLFKPLADIHGKELIASTFTANRESWIKFIALSLFFLDNFLNSPEREYVNRPKPYQKVTKTFESLNYFRDRNFEVVVKEGEFNENLINDVYKAIEDKISYLGENFVFSLMNLIERYKQPYKLYYFPVNKTYLELASEGSAQHILPLGLLFRLAIKHFGQVNNLSQEELDRKFNEILEYSDHLGNLLCLIGYGQDYGLLFSDRSDILQFMRRFMRLDQIYKIDQYKPEYIYELTKELVGSLSNSALPNGLLERLNLIMAIFDVTIDESRDKTCFCINNTSGYTHLTSVYTKEIIDEELTKLSHIGAVNQEFKSLNDLAKVDYFYKPFIKLKRNNCDQFLLLNKTFFMMGFLTEITEILRLCRNLEDGSKFSINAHLGQLQEDLLKKRIAAAGLSVLSGTGEYKVDGELKKALGFGRDTNRFETDIVVEQKERIIFMEAKRKGLTGLAKNGDEISILLDLAQSLIYSQVQANRHCRILKHSEKLNYIDGKELELANRQLSKVTVTQFDFGSIQSFRLRSQFLKIMYNSIVNHVDAANKKKIDDINKELIRFREEFGDGKSFFNPSNQHMLFADCQFVNFFQLLYLIDRVDHQTGLTIEEIFEKVFSTQNISTNAYDFYFEFESILALNPKN